MSIRKFQAKAGSDHRIKGIMRLPVLALTPIAIAFLSTTCAGKPSNGDEQDPPTKFQVEQRVLDQPARILEQIKGSVCGSGPYYAGNVDDPVFVTPLLHASCSISPIAPDRR